MRADQKASELACWCPWGCNAGKIRSVRGERWGCRRSLRNTGRRALQSLGHEGARLRHENDGDWGAEQCGRFVQDNDSYLEAW